MLVKNWMDIEEVLHKVMSQKIKDKFDNYRGNLYNSDHSKKGKRKRRTST